MMFCPMCGAAMVNPPSMRMRSTQFSKLHQQQQERCLCAMPLEVLERTAISLEEALHDIIKEYFPGTTRKELQEAIRKLPKGDPLRSEMNQRMTYLQRLKDRRADVIKHQELDKDKDPETNQDGTLTFSGILADYSGKPKPPKPL